MVEGNENRMSDCCVSAMYDDSDICPNCKEHCETYVFCKECGWLRNENEECKKCLVKTKE